MAENLNNEFWQFSLSTYGDSRLSKCLLLMQNNYGANINCMLMALYAAKCGYYLESEHWLQFRKASDLEQQACTEARRIRMSLKNSDQQLYQQAKEYELQLEQLHQEKLYNTLQDIAVNTSGKPLAMDNMCSYWQASFKRKLMPPELESLVKSLN